MFFSIEDKIIIPSDYKERNWSSYKIWKNHPKNRIIHWIEDMAQGGLGLFLQKKT